MGEDALVGLRPICLGLPKVVERLSHGEPTWFARGRTAFVMAADHHHDRRLAFWCAADRLSPGVMLRPRPTWGRAAA